MKKTYITAFFAILPAIFLASCEGVRQGTALSDVCITVLLDGERFPENADVTLLSQNHAISYKTVSRAGIARFSLPAGIYDVSVTCKTEVSGETVLYNGRSSLIVFSDEDAELSVSLEMSTSSQIVIKELYVGGCQADDGSGLFHFDKYVILYNNGDTEVDAGNICFAFTSPLNSNVISKYMTDGMLSYEAEDWIPAMYAIWWFETDVVIAPYSQIVVAINGAIDNTATYSRSVDLSKPEYYVMYDPESGYTLQSYYPVPSSNIPESHYLKTYAYGGGTAWALSNTSPGFFILDNADISSLVKDGSYYDYTDNAARPNMRIPEEWVVDAVEVFRTDYAINYKRFPSTLDAGSVKLRSQQGYTLYRNVDAEATEALPENEGLLVYGYSGGTDAVEGADGSTDPSGIDAEASIANGAHIIYQDTNNSSVDFHQRAVSSLK